MRSPSLGLTLARLVLASSLLALPPSAGAAPPEDPPWSVKEVVITAQRKGPVFWRVSRGESEVWILGAPTWLPRDQAWSTAGVERVLRGAHVLLTQPVGQAGLFTTLGMLTHLGLPHGQTLQARLTPDQKARFAEALVLARTPAARYDHDKGVWAALKLMGDYMSAAKLAPREPQATVTRLAQAHHVPVRPVAVYKAKASIQDLLALPAPEDAACLADAADDIAFASVHARAAAKAWSTGDLKTVKANYAEPRIALCLEQSASFKTLSDRAVDDTIRAIDTALATPGKTVMIASLGTLLRQDGALERLRARGVAITAPDE
jgi:uncharacterized protein YbaP (TraB family)